MCNNNCCTCCQCGTHDDDTPQEITYTSVCNSDVCKDKDGCRCCCCKNKGVCEDDPNIRLDGMEERMEECCEEVNERITNIECKLCEEISRSKSEDLKHDNNDKQHDDAIEDLYNRESIDVNNVVYVNTPGSEVIEFWHVFPEEDEKDPIKIGEVDAKPFLKDGILDSVELESNGHVLHFVWNTDAGKQDSHVDLDRLIQPIALELSEYKTYVSNTYETRTAAGNHYKEAEINGRRITLKKENGDTTTLDVPEDLLVKQNVCTDDVEIPILLAYGANPTSGTSAQANYSSVTINPHTTIINGTVTNAIKDDHNNNIYNTYETKSEAADHLNEASWDPNTRRLVFTRPSGQNTRTFTIDDTNNFVTSGTLSGSTLILNRQGLTPVTINMQDLIPTDNDHYPDTARIDNNRVLHLTGANFDELTVQLPVDNDKYITGGSVVNNQLILTRTDGDLSPIQLPSTTIPKLVSDVTYNSTTNVLTVSYSDGSTPATYTIAGDTTSLEQRIAKLESYWKIDDNDNTKLIALNGRSATAAGFYDSTVNTV